MSVSSCGYHGRYLRIDLSTRVVRAVPLPTEVLRGFLGGAGLGTWLLLEETDGSPAALSPEAPLVFVFSPLVGSPLTTSAKFAVLAKSPLTGRINDSLSSSHFAIAGKKTGYDAIVIVGAAEKPTCLVVEPDRVRFDNATPAWGHSVSDSQDYFRDQLGRTYQLATIGPAGENLVRFAGVSHDGRHAGRGGLGAVMGSKRLKAIAVRGDRLTDVAHPDRLAVSARKLSKKSLGAATAKYRELGTVGNLRMFDRLGVLPTRNFQSGTFAGAANLTPESLSVGHRRTQASCAACTIGCEHIFHLNSPLDPQSAEHSLADQKTGVRMEYENLFALGPLCGISDPEIVLRASKQCDELGMDTISAGATVAFAMECAERGLIDAPDLRFGNGAALLKTLRQIGQREGLGNLLADGTRAAAETISQGADEFAPHVKGLEIPGYEPRALQTMALGFAVGTRGADHNRSGAYQADFSEQADRLHAGPESVRLAIETEDEAAIMDSVILCKFLRGVFDDRFAAMAEMLELVTGWDITPSELQETAQRIVTAKKWYNIRQGWTPLEDTLPRRFLSESLPDGTSAGALLTETTLQELIRQYNLSRGWTADGWIPDEQLAKLGIGSAIHAGVRADQFFTWSSGPRIPDKNPGKAVTINSKLL